jgi:hypothetical protein
MVPRVILPAKPRTSLALAALLLLAVFFQVRWSPPNHKVHVDGTVFAYGGSRILKGEIPYRDFMDNKPPGVYYLDALAFRVFGADAWGIWYLTVIWTALISAVFFLFMRLLLRTGHALVITACLLAALLEKTFYQGSNLTEFYGLLPSVGALYLSARYIQKPRPSLAVWLGTMFALGVLLKPTNAGTASACMLVIFIWEGLSRNVRKLGGLVLRFLAPSVLVLLVVSIYWGMNGALADLWQATVQFNLLYFSGGFSIRGLYVAFRRFAVDPALAIPFTLASATILMLWRSRPRKLSPPGALDRLGSADSDRMWWIYLASIGALSFEILLISTTGKDFGHYYEISLPSLFASASYWARFETKNHTEDTPVRPARLRLPTLLIGALLVWLLANFGLIRPSVDDLRSFILDAPVRRPLRTDVGKFISANTTPDDSVLVWSIGAELNFETGRRSPSPYVYYKPLFVEGFQNSERWREFLDDLRAHPPSLIITQVKGGYAPDFDVPEDQLARTCGCEGDILAGFTEFSSFVKENYAGQLMFDGVFKVYRPAEDLRPE